MKIVFDEDDVEIAAKAMAKSRGFSAEWIATMAGPYAPDSTQDKIFTEARRVIAAFRNKYGQ